jgi:hypothetical protein
MPASVPVESADALAFVDVVDVDVVAAAAVAAAQSAFVDLKQRVSRFGSETLVAVLFVRELEVELKPASAVQQTLLRKWTRKGERIHCIGSDNVAGLVEEGKSRIQTKVFY